MSLGPRCLTGMRAPMILLVTLASVPAAVANPKQTINRIPLLCGRLGVRKLQVHS
jgi:hypothetical protein